VRLHLDVPCTQTAFASRFSLGELGPDIRDTSTPIKYVSGWNFKSEDQAVGLCSNTKRLFFLDKLVSYKKIDQPIVRTKEVLPVMNGDNCSSVDKSRVTLPPKEGLDVCSTGCQKEDEFLLNADYMANLQLLQQRLGSMNDESALKKVIQIIQASGKYSIKDSTFDFDLCTLDVDTIRKLNDCLQCFVML